MRDKLPPELASAQQRLYALADVDPRAAIAEARTLPDGLSRQAMLRACLLTDAGIAAKDESAIREGARMFRRFLAKAPKVPGIAYNLANALAGLARIEPTRPPRWFQATARLRAEERALLGQAAPLLKEGNREGASQCLTNLGNALDRAHRWIEAFDAYLAALDACPDNGVASGSAAKLLGRIARHGVLGERAHLGGLSLRYAWHAQENRKTVEAFAGPAAVQSFEKLPSKKGDLPVATQRRLSAYQAFVAKHRLALAPVLEGLRPGPRWDSAHIQGIHERVGAGPLLPPIFAMFNTLKADYLLARELLFAGFQEWRPDTSWYADTLDYASYGKPTAALVLAQRSALDLLDRLAVALNEYLGVGLPPDRIHFSTFWTASDDGGWREAISKEIEDGNPGLLALTEIATDLGAKALGESAALPLLSRYKRLRNTGTHRFTILHDLVVGEHRTSDAVEHIDITDFRQAATETVRLARAAFLHGLEAIAFRERRTRPKSGFAPQMAVVGHHYIRRGSR